MAQKRAFISFDFDHDVDLKNLVVGQSKHPDTDFEIVDMSIKEAIATNWRESARRRIKGCDVVIVICGEEGRMGSNLYPWQRCRGERQVLRAEKELGSHLYP